MQAHQLPARRRLLAAATAALALCSLAPAASAQAFPNKPIRFIIASAPGGGTDAIGRVIADTLAAHFKQPVVPENRPGASGVIASEMVYRAPPDGYTIAIVQNGHTVNPAIIKKLPYDTLNDFTPVASLARSPLVLIAASPSGVKTVKEMLELGRRTPASMNFASAETSSRLAVEMMSGASGLPMNTVYYKGTGPAVTDVAGGHVNFTVTTIASTLAHRDGGKINYLAAMAPERSPFLPEVPTLAEQGLPDITVLAWWGIIAPPNLPKPILQTLNSAIRDALASAEVKKRMDVLSVSPWPQSPEDFDKFLRKEVEVTLNVARKAGIQAE
ncbi:MAG: tripartite tricarboxylate transporter substrate-binding protein [Pseudomonadota bacterium]